MDLTASANQLPIWVILIAILIPLIINVIGLIVSRKKADKTEVMALNLKLLELDKRLGKCERIRDYLIEHSSPEVKLALKTYLDLSQD